MRRVITRGINYALRPFDLNLSRNHGPGPAPQDKRPGVVFMHIPKTGGSSLSKSLHSQFPDSTFRLFGDSAASAAEALYGIKRADVGASQHIQALNLAVVSYMGAQGVKAIHGHFWYGNGLVALKEQGYLLATLFRNPVDRWFSQFFYNFYQGNKLTQPIDAEFERYIGSWQAQFLGRTYTQLLCGHYLDGGIDAAVIEAKGNLEKFDIVGIMEDFNRDAVDLAKHGLSLKIPHENKGRTPSKVVARFKESLEVRSQVEAICAPDIDIYESARAMQSGN